MNDKEKKIEPKAFTVKVECLVPTTISYRVTALTEQDALKEIDKITAQATQIQHNIKRKIKLKASVYAGSTSMLKLSKNYRSM